MDNSKSILAYLCLLIGLLSGCGGVTQLHKAAYYNSMESAKQLIKDGADVNAKTRHNFVTPLHNAAAMHLVEMVKLLIEHGADVNAKSDQSVTPLYNAITVRNDDGNKIDTIETVKILIEHGADVNIEASNHTNPLYAAVYYKDYDIARLLIAAGSEIKIPNNNNAAENCIAAMAYEIAGSYFEEKGQKDKSCINYQSAVKHYKLASEQYDPTKFIAGKGILTSIGFLVDLAYLRHGMFTNYGAIALTSPSNSNSNQFIIDCNMAIQKCENACGKPVLITE